ncbi:hypothetical protein [Streptomyces canus]|uniref:hypothetical protein n=1 Tax=Streptomyces canus TaxID=58343 RepID=UPI0032566CD3
MPARSEFRSELCAGGSAGDDEEVHVRRPAQDLPGGERPIPRLAPVITMVCFMEGPFTA